MANIPIDWPYLAEALVLLFFPLGLLLGRKVGWRGFTSATVGGDFSWWQSWLKIPVLWLDAPRAYLGTLLLGDPNFAFPHGRPQDATVRLMLILGVLGVAQLAQMFMLRQSDDDERSLAAPVSFLIGLLFALVPQTSHGLLVAGLATLVATACAAGFRSWHGFFLGGIGGLILPGFLLLGKLTLLLAPVLLLFEPVLVSLVFQRELVVPVRRV
jgi:hypothetical protein